MKANLLPFPQISWNKIKQATYFGKWLFYLGGRLMLLEAAIARINREMSVPQLSEAA